MRKILVRILWILFIVGSFVVPVMAQGTTIGYTAQVRFFYPCFCTLQNMRVTLSDQTGRVLATALSPDGSMVMMPVRLERPAYSLTASVSGYAIIGQYSMWRVGGVNTLSVQTTGGEYPIIVFLYKT
jgi:hypothetical protein